MAKAILSKRKADAISNGVLLISLGILFYLNAWWPGILLAVWAWLGARQYFTGRHFDLTITTIILIGLFLIDYFNVQLLMLMPILFTVGGVYIIFREYFFSDDTNGESKADEIRHDIEK